jgi:hypothetical protein
MNILTIVVVLIVLVGAWVAIIRLGSGWSMFGALVATVILAIAIAEGFGLISLRGTWLRPDVKHPRVIEPVIAEPPKALAPIKPAVPDARKENTDLLKKFREGTP